MVRTWLIPFICLFCFCIALFFNQKISYPVIQIDKQDVALNFKPETIKVLSIGLKRLISDLVWIQTLMESDLEHYKKKDLNSWLYLRFKTISELDPLFYENYHFGGQYLMIVKDDLLASEKHLLKGLQHFNDDLSLNWQLGYMYAIEQNEPKKSLPFFEKIKGHPARPKMFDNLYSKILNNALGPESALEFITTYIKEYPLGDDVRERLELIAYSIRAEIDLECLNKGNMGCNERDLRGERYIKKREGWIAPSKTIKTVLSKRPSTQLSPE